MVIDFPARYARCGVHQKKAGDGHPSMSIGNDDPGMKTQNTKSVQINTYNCIVVAVIVSTPSVACLRFTP